MENAKPRKNWIVAGLLIPVAMVFCGCSAGGEAVSAIPLADLDFVPRLADSPATTKAIDNDRDGIPDDVELAIGTDPENHDSDHDGLTDHYELWGIDGLAVGIVGDISQLPDANGNGVIAALDPGDMGDQVLKNASNILNQERVPVTLPEEGVWLPNDMDGDGIPNDFELHGFIFIFDENLEPFFVKWDGLVNDTRYFKTDPTKWSTDGDPFSDWEEATRINLDQRVKTPGDHPNIPAYPNMHIFLGTIALP